MSRNPRQLVTCPGFAGYCSEAYPGDTCTGTKLGHGIVIYLIVIIASYSNGNCEYYLFLQSLQWCVRLGVTMCQNVSRMGNGVTFRGASNMNRVWMNKGQNCVLVFLDIARIPELDTCANSIAL